MSLVRTLREQWSFIGGVSLASAIALQHVLRVGLSVELLSVPHSVLAGTFLSIALGSTGQLILNKRMAFKRERNLVRTAAQLREVSSELDRIARTDGLTGLANARAFNDVLGVEWRRSVRYGRDVAALFVDIDHLKRVNDRYGHRVGSLTISHVGLAIAAVLRKSDIIGRYGGDEFVAILPETRYRDAVVIAEEVRQSIEALRLDVIEPGLRVTVSIGVASAEPPSIYSEPSTLLDAADRQLLLAKAQGRNRVAS